MANEWLHADLTREVNAPLTNLPGERSAEKLRAVVDQFDVENALRYRVRDITGDGKPETFCNKFVSGVTRALFAEIPAQFQGRWLDVRGQADWIRRDLGKWRRVESWLAQAAADKGHPTIALYDPVTPGSRGHVALLVPSEGRPGIWIAQAGARNFRRAPLMAGFGLYASDAEFWTHE